MSFDTLAYTQKLRSAGMPPDQAEAHAEALKAALAEEVATKSDLKAVETALRRDMEMLEERLRHEITMLEERLHREIATLEERLRSEIATAEERLRREIADSKTDVIKWMAGFAVAQIIVLFGVLLKV